MKIVNFKFSNGNKVKDSLTNVEGIINASSIWINGCIRYSVQPKAKKGENIMPESWWVDEAQLILLEGGIKIEEKETGGPSTKSPKF